MWLQEKQAKKHGNLVRYCRASNGEITALPNGVGYQELSEWRANGVGRTGWSSIYGSLKYIACHTSKATSHQADTQKSNAA